MIILVSDSKYASSYHDSHHNHDTHSGEKSWLYLLREYFQMHIDLIAGIIVAGIVVVYGAIRLKKAGQGQTLAARPTLYPLPALYATATSYNARGFSEFLKNRAHVIWRASWFTSSKLFLVKKIPSRLWNFYIRAFLIPTYRQEWGKYRNWCPRSPLRIKNQSRQQTPLHTKPADKGVDSTMTPSACPVPSSVEEEASASNLPKPVPHNHSECQRIRINVGGCIYETQLRTLRRYPHTLLGDPNRRLRFFDPVNQEYFFDRNRASFESILYYYQSGGRLKRPDNISADILLDDAKFYGLPQSVVYQYLCDEGLSGPSESEDIVPHNLLMRKIWLLFDFPQSSMQAQIVSLISILAITISITTFCLETLDSLSSRYRYFLDSSTDTAFGTGTRNSLDLHDPFFFTETWCSIWFLVEYLVRLASSPMKTKFFLDTLNIIDLIAVLPYFVQIAVRADLESRNDQQNQSVLLNKRPTGSVSVIRVVRLVRVFRIFKLSRHSRGLKILGKTLSASLNELLLLIFFVMIGVVLFSSTMYFAELGNDDTYFHSIPDGFWWALITITTVGYGDNVPKSPAGKIVGALCCVAGVLTLALPVPVIVSNFNFFYHQALGEDDLSWTKINHTTPCPFRPIDSFAATDPSPYSDSKGQKRQHGRRRKSSSTDQIHPIVPYSSDEDFGMLKFESDRRFIETSFVNDTAAK